MDKLDISARLAPASGVLAPPASIAVVTDRDATLADRKSGAAGQRVTSLDAIRGIAALLVVLGHAIEEAIRFLPAGTGIRNLLEAIAIDYMNFGRVGVVAFFAVSGYVIPFSFAHSSPVRSFMIARFFRLYPAYWVSIVGAVALAVLIEDGMPPLAQILANITMVQYVLGQPDLIGVYWTLFYELVFYGLCLGAFILGRMQSPYYLVSMVAAFSLLGLVAAALRHSGMATGVPIGIFVFLAIMHLGTLARLSDRDGTALARKCLMIGLAVVVLTAGPIVSIGFIQKAGNQRLITDVTGLYAGLALFFALRRRQDIVNQTSLFLGKISYSLYLMHPLCLVALVAAAHQISPTVAPLFVLLGIPTTAILLAAASQMLVEAPANEAGRRVRKAVLKS